MYMYSIVEFLILFVFIAFFCLGAWVFYKEEFPEKISKFKNKVFFSVIFEKYALFSGRATRKEYWSFYIINTIIGGILSVLSFDEWNVVIYSFVMYQPIPKDFVFSWLIVYMSFASITLLPSIAVTVRRLHDTGRSGLWLLAPILLLAPALYFDTYIGLIFTLIAFIISLILTIMVFIFMLLDSQKGDNKYGRNPKQDNRDQELNKSLDNVVNHAITYPDVFVKLIPSQYPLTISDFKKYSEKDAKGMIFGVLANLSGIEINFNSNIDMVIMTTLTKATDRIYEGICK